MSDAILWFCFLVTKLYIYWHFYSCTNDQEVDFKGSHTADRTCRRRIIPKRDIPAPVKPTIKATNKTKYDKKSGMGDGDMSQSMEEKNGTVGKKNISYHVRFIIKVFWIMKLISPTFSMKRRG